MYGLVIRCLPIIAGVFLTSAVGVVKAEPVANLPQLPEIQHGDISITTSPQDMQINQSSQYGIIDWQSFNVGADHGVHFANGQGATLNRVTGVDVSHIYGSLTSTGSVFLLNSNGIIVGEGGSILTAGDFVGSTLTLSNEDFLDGGGLKFVGESDSGITNLGRISSSGGNVLLSAYTLTNAGVIEAPSGRVGLATGTEIDILTDVSWGQGIYSVKVGERGQDITNEGRIASLVSELRTHNGNIYALAGNNEGLIQATGVRNVGGQVFLTAEQGILQSSGTISAQINDAGGQIHIEAAVVENYGGIQDVSGTTGGTISVRTQSIVSDTLMLANGLAGDGGNIFVESNGETLFTSGGLVQAEGTDDGGEVAITAGDGRLIFSGNLSVAGQMQGGRASLLGDHVALLGGVVIADGGPLGGEIYIGGGYQGQSIWSDLKEPFSVSNSSRTYVSETSLLSADAGYLGKGGTVVAWSDGVTEFAGTVYARGGTEGGDGGLVETSGFEGLGVSGSVDASARAPYGEDGEWLLDPTNIIIDEISDPINEFRSQDASAGGFRADQLATSFGSNVAVSGNTVVVTGLFRGSSESAAYVFEDGRIAARITRGSTIPGSQFNSIDRFGEHGVDILDDIIAVLDLGDSRGNATGALNIFHKGNGWQNGSLNQTARVYNPWGNASSQFGFGGVELAEVNNTVYAAVADTGFPPSSNLMNAGHVAYTSISASGVASFFSTVQATTPQANARFGGDIELAEDGSLFISDTFGGLTVFSVLDSSKTHFGGVLSSSNTFIGTTEGDLYERTNFGFRIHEFTDVGGTLTRNPVDVHVNMFFLGGSGPTGPGTTGGAVSGNTVILANSDIDRNSLSRDSSLSRNGVVVFFVEPDTGWASCIAVFLTVCGSGSSYFGDAGDQLGSDIDIDGTVAVAGARGGETPGAVAGAGRAFIFNHGSTPTWANRNDWVKDPVLIGPAVVDTGSRFGQDNGIAIDGNTYVVGDRSYGNQLGGNNGGLFVYENGALAAVLVAPYLTSSTGFNNAFTTGLGAHVDIAGDAIVAADTASTPHILFFEKGSGWRNGGHNVVRSLQSQAAPIQALSLDDGGFAFSYQNTASRNFPVNVINKTTSSWSTSSLAFSNGFINVTNGGSVQANQFGYDLDLEGNTLVASRVLLTGDHTNADVHVFETNDGSWRNFTETILTPGDDAVHGGGFGGSLGLSGNTLVVGHGNLQSVNPSSVASPYTRGAFVYEKNGDWASSVDPVAVLTAGDTVPNFGAWVDVDDDRIIVSNSPAFTGHQTSIFVFEKQSGWADGVANLVATLRRSDGRNDTAVNAIAISGSTIVTASCDDPNASQNVDGCVAYEYHGPYDINSRHAFGFNAADDITLSANSLAGSLSLGTNITLQAHNDITVRSAIAVNNPGGDGGTLTFEAGRSILILNDISTDNGDLNLFANDADADSSKRTSGEGVVVLGKDASNNDAILNFGTGTLTINGGDRFENRSSTTNPFVFDAANGGRYVVYSSRPDGAGAPDQANLGKDISITGRNFLQYNTTFDSTDPLPNTLPTGSGFVYAVQPQLSVDVGGATITYGQSATAALSLSGATVDGVSLDAQGLRDYGLDSATLTNLVDTGLASSVPTSAGGFAHAGTHVGGLTATPKATVSSGSLFGVGVSTGAAGDLTVNKAQLTGDVDNHTREYGSADALTISYTGFIAGDDASVLDVAPTLSSSQGLDTDIGVYVGALTASGGSDNNYDLTFTSGDLTINKKQITVTGLAGVNRSYDGSTAATFTGTPAIDILASDTGSVSLTGALTAMAVFGDKLVDTGKALTVSGFGLDGPRSGNYNLVQPAYLTADIIALELTVTGLAAADRVYDATTGVGLTGSATISPLAGDTVLLSGTATGNFADKQVGENKGITLSGLTLSGADSGNYTLSLSNSLSASITALDLFVTGLTADSRIYDATTNATLSGTGQINLLGGDTAALSGSPNGTFADRHVGTGKSVAVTGYTLTGVDADNYNLIHPTGLTADITPLDVAVTGVTAENKVYDAATGATLTGTPAVMALGTDVVAVDGTASASFADKNVASAKSITITGYTLTGVDSGNYNLLQPAGLTADITARPLTVTGLAPDDKRYDATTAATGTGTATFGGILAGDTVTIDDSGFTLAFVDKNVGTAKPIAFSGIVLTGADAGNYDASAIDGFTAEITAAPVTITGVTAADRVYDGTTDANLSGGTLNGVIGGDTVTLNLTTSGSFADKNAGTDKAVTTSGFSVSGADAGNYAVTQPTGLTATITAAPLNLTGVNGDRVYDGTTDAPLNHTGFDAVLGSDVVTLDDAGVSSSFADKNAATGKAITITGNFALSGIDAGNYALTQPGNVVGDITPKGITVEGLTIADKVYDGTTEGEISGTGTFGGVVEGDEVAIDVGVVNITYADKNAGEDKAVALSGITLSGADAGNYNAATPTGITGTITAKDLAVTGYTAENKVYDRTDAATVNGSGVLDGVIDGDTVALDESLSVANFDDKNVGQNKTVTVNDLTISGADADNYNLVAPTTTANITAAPVTVIGLNGGSRVYDGSATAPLEGVATLDFGSLAASGVSDDAALVGSASGVFADKNVGTGKLISVSGLQLAGADQGNYNLFLPSGLTGSVTPLDVTVSGVTANDKVYDATTLATLSGSPTVGTLAGDAVSLAGGDDATFSDKNVGSGKSVTITPYTLTGADAGNYTLTQPGALAASITPAALTVTGINADNKPYDGTTSAPLSGSPVFNTLGSDSVNLAGQITASFDSKDAGESKPVAIEGILLGGPDAGNYELTVPGLTANITPLEIILSGITAADKVYDGTTEATVSGDPSLNILAGDAVTFDATTLTATFAQSDVGTDISIALMGDGLMGVDAQNYTLVLPFDLTAQITPRELLILNALGVDRSYDQTTTVAITGGELDDVVAGDDVTLAGTPTGQTTDANVGSDKPVAVSGFELAGSDAANYTVDQPEDVTVEISPRPLEVTGIEVVEKFFDGTTDATFSGGQVQGFFTGDSVTLDSSAAVATFFDATVGNDKPVEIAGLTLSGEDAGNYTIDPVTLLGNILAELAVITDVVPPEVLRVSAERTLEAQRQQLNDLANAQNDTITLTDFEAVAPQNSVDQPDIIDGILDTPEDQRDDLTSAYVEAARRAQEAKNTYDNSVSLYGRQARYHKELGAAYNQAQRDLQVESALLEDLQAEVDRVDTELAKVEENIETIDEAKRRIREYQQKLEEATRLGRGADVAEFQQIIADAEAIVAQEAQVLAQKAGLEELSAESRSRLTESQEKIAELEQQSETLLVEIDEAEARVEEARVAVSSLEEGAERQAQTLEQLRLEGAALFTTRMENLAEAKAEALDQLASTQALAESDLPERTAELTFQQDLSVIEAQSATKAAGEAKQVFADAVKNSLGDEGLAFAEQLATEANSPQGLQRTPDEIRDGLVAASSALQAQERAYEEAARRESELLSALAGTMALNPEEVADRAAQERAGLDTDRILEITNEMSLEVANEMLQSALQENGLDLSGIPDVDVDGNPISQLEKIAMAMVKSKLESDLGGALDFNADDPMGSLADQYLNTNTGNTATDIRNSYNGRVADSVLGEFGLTKEEVINDPGVLLDEVGDRIPTDKNSAIDLATEAAAARIRLDGVLKDSAMEEAEARDPTGTLKSVNDIERAAEQAFVDEYGDTPEELLIKMMEERADDYKNAENGEELLELYLQDATPQQAQMAKEALQRLANGDSPQDIIGDIRADRELSREQSARAARTAQAARDAAMGKAEEADKTGTLRAMNNVQAAFDDKIAEALGGSPEDLAIDAIENPEAALSKMMDVGENLTSFDGAVATANMVGDTMVNAATSQARAALDELSKAAEKLGGMGEAIKAVADFGGDVIDFAEKGVNEVKEFFGGGDSGPSADEIAFMKAQGAALLAEANQKRAEALSNYLKAAEAMATAKLQLAVGIENAKQQVTGYVVTAKSEAQAQEHQEIVTTATKKAISDHVQNQLDAKVRQSQVSVDLLGDKPEEMAAQAAMWASQGG